jgi:predicted Zn-dependent peptidase
MKKPKISKLDNGLSIMTIERKESSTTTVSIFVKTGSKDETKENNGISHFLEHMMFKGTKKRPGKIVSRELDSLGASFNAFTNYEHTGYYAIAATKSWKKILDILADIYKNSTFPEKEIEKERGVIKGEYDMYQDNHHYVADEDLVTLLYKGQPAGMPIIGTKENINTFKRNDFLEYYSKRYVPGNTIVVIAGGVSHKDVISEAKRHFKGLPKKEKTKREKVDDSQKKPAIHIHKRETEQSHIRLALRSVHGKHKDRFVSSMMAAILGGCMSSRLFEKLRDDMGAGYYVQSYDYRLTDHGIFVISTGTEPKRTTEVIHAVLDELRTLKRSLVSEKELKKIKELLYARLMRSIETSHGLGDFYTDQYILDEKYLTPLEITKIIKAITPEDIQKFAKKYFVSKNLNCAIVGPINKTKKLVEAVKI